MDLDAASRPIVLRKVMEVLFAKGFTHASMQDLTAVAGIEDHRLHKAFGTREEILRAAIRCCAETEASLAHESLQASSSGREALLCMLEEHVRLMKHWPNTCSCLFTLNALVVPPDDAALQDFLTQKRRSLSRQIRLRLTQSVSEGELPERTKVEAIANLCVTLLGGLTLRILNGTPSRSLFRCIEHFVQLLGFAPSRRHTRSGSGRGAKSGQISRHKFLKRSKDGNHTSRNR
jgi:AcrR family transcriptional regulator